MMNIFLKSLTIASVLATSLPSASSEAGILRCKIAGYSEDIFITTAPDTNVTDGKYSRIGRAPGLGNQAIVMADRMGATAFIELNADGTPIGMITVQKDLKVVKSSHAIDTLGLVIAPSQGTGECIVCKDRPLCAR